MLEVLTSCEGCGACCREQGAPPDYVALRLNRHFADDPSFAEDAVRLQSLPPEAERLLDEYLSLPANARGAVCVWFDEAERRCRFYEHRPSTCRVFELDSPGCHIYRRRQAIESEPTGQ
jgi:uncharacterized protein